jgi:hypothetical protein
VERLVELRVTHHQRDDSSRDIETGAERSSNQIADARVGETLNWNGCQARGEQDERGEHRQHIKKMENLVVTPRQSAGGKYGDGEPSDALE